MRLEWVALVLALLTGCARWNDPLTQVQRRVGAVQVLRVDAFEVPLGA